MGKEKATERGVVEAWAYWLNDHPVSVPEMIEASIERAFRKWLDENGDKVTEAIRTSSRGDKC